MEAWEFIPKGKCERVLAQERKWNAIDESFNKGYELYSQGLGIKFRHYENFADTFQDMNSNNLYIDFNHNGTVEVCMTPYGNFYKNRSPKTERLFSTLDNTIKEVKKALGVK